MQENWYRYRYHNCNCNIKKIWLNLDKLHGFLLLSNRFFVFQLQKTLHKVIVYKVFNAGSGSAVKKQLDPDPH